MQSPHCSSRTGHVRHSTVIVRSWLGIGSHPFQVVDAHARGDHRHALPPGIRGRPGHAGRGTADNSDWPIQVGTARATSVGASTSHPPRPHGVGPAAVAAPDLGHRPQRGAHRRGDLEPGVDVADVHLVAGARRSTSARPARRRRRSASRRPCDPAATARRGWCAARPTAAGAGRGPPRPGRRPTGHPRPRGRRRPGAAPARSRSARRCCGRHHARRTTPARSSRRSRFDSSAGDIFGLPRRSSLKCRLPSSSSRTTSRVQRSSSTSIAFAIGQNCP